MFYSSTKELAPKVTTVEFATNSKCENIGASAFYNCIYLSTISLPGSLKMLSSSAFSVCLSLTYISIPENVNIIYDNVFYGCDNLASVEFKNVYNWKYSYGYAYAQKYDVPSAYLLDPAYAATYIKGEGAEYYWTRT